MSNNTASSTLLYGLKPNVIIDIQRIFQQHPNITKAILYGSRAKGNYKIASDIDLTLEGEQLNYAELIKVELELDELLLPYTIDLSIYHQIDNPDLIEHIQRVGKIFYTNQ